MIAFSSSTLAGSIRGEWNAPPTGRRSARLAPASLSLAQAASTASTLPEITSWPGQLVRRHDHAVDRGAGFLYFGVVESQDRRHRTGYGFAGFLHGHRTFGNEPQTVFERKSAGHHQGLKNSPSECPATASGFTPSALAMMTEWRNTAGWVTLVCLSSSSVPANMMSVMRKPRISVGLLEESLGFGDIVVEVFAHADGLSAPDPEIRMRVS